MYSIERHIAPVVERRAKNNKAILLTGPRQVGKSTLFNHLFHGVNKVTFDDDLLLAQADEDIGLWYIVSSDFPMGARGFLSDLCLAKRCPGSSPTGSLTSDSLARISPPLSDAERQK